jgi:hypothetical protein
MDAQTNTIPEDENGTILRRMMANGDDLSKPRITEFLHVFAERPQALAFAGVVDDRQDEVCISFNDGSEMWDVIVKRHMVPTHEEITAIQNSLTAQAEQAGGKADGWGCVTVKKKSV